MTEAQIARINELTRLSRLPEGLTEEQQAERQELRRAYIEAMKRSLTSQLDNTYIVDETGKHKLKKKE